FEWISGVSFQKAFEVLPGFVPALMLMFPLAIGLIAGFYPAFVIASLRPVASLKGLSTTSGFSLRTPLVVVQFGITSFLLISTGVIIHQLDYMQNRDPGFNQDQVVILNVGGPGINRKIDVFRSELLRNPNVVNVSASLTLPGDLTYTMPYSISETLYENSENFPGFYVDPQFVSNMGIEVVSGRAFSDDIITDTLNFMLNESAVKELVARHGPEWNDPVGKPLHYFRSSNSGWRVAKSGVIIGVVRDFNFASLHHAIQPMVLQVDYKLLYKVLVKIRPENTPSTVSFLRDTWNQQNFGRPFNFQFLDERFAQAYEKEKSFGNLFTCLAILSIMISAFGLYGLVLHTTSRRSKEISIRKVLGANTSSLVALLGKGFLRPVIIAFVLISPLAYYLMSLWLTQFAYQQGIGIAIFLQSASACVLITGVTVLSRTLKVSRANPVQFLR
ncbi:MAG TPA: FtsX-like permease family protein, partial [Cyclobacteriaceae bacterium]|nr:FtsX-like permease family protein [Cyclobacteriaceae bacterium]